MIDPINKNPSNDFTYIKLIGRGAYARVFKVQSRETSKFFALKHIELQEIQANQVREEFYNSVIVECANIVPSYALYSYNNSLAILEELMWGTLSNFIKLEKNLNEGVIAYIMRECLKGLEFLHKRNIIHRDIKCENIFISNEGC